MSVKSILFVVGSLEISGGTNIILNHANYLQKKGYKLTIAYYHNSDIKWHKSLESKEIQFIDINKLDSNKIYDICIFTHYSTIQSVIKVNAMRFVYFIQSIESLFNTNISSMLVAQFSYTYGLPYISVSNWISEYLGKHYQIKGPVVLNGLDSTLFNNTYRKKNSDKFVVLIEGQLDRPTKNTNYAIEQALNSKADEVILLTNTKIKKYSKLNKVYSNIPYNEVHKIYSQCDVLLKLSHVEGMYGPPLESFACGATVITNKVSGHEEYIVNNKNALVIERDKDATDAINYLYDNRDVLERLQKNALLTAQNWVNLEESGANFEKALINIAKENSPNIINKQNIINSINTCYMLANYIQNREQINIERKTLKNKIKMLFKRKKYVHKNNIEDINLQKKCLKTNFILK